jgi:2-polyprenyl-6-methoxyphenol hydroxylase-like FAD-dependent oxidoreductase
MNDQPRCAIVMGASVGGLWAARVLADHFDQVLILERDSLPEGPELRPGVPQSRQYHIMLLKGLQIMDDLFPGLRDELIGDGAIPFDTVNDVAVRSRGKWLPRFPSDQYLLSCSRLLLEAGMRRHLRRIAPIHFVENVTVTGLEADDHKQRITGVHVSHRNDNERAETFSADLVVDALGRRSPTPEWLTALGYDAPEESSVNSFLGYVTRRYRIPNDFQADWRMLMILATPPDQPRGGLIIDYFRNQL